MHYRSGRPIWAGILIVAVYFALIPWALNGVGQLIGPVGTDVHIPLITVPVGLFLCLLGIYVAARGYMILAVAGKNWPGGKPMFLVKDYTYRVVRHPIYWGYTVYWIGRSILQESVGLLIASGIMGAVFALAAMIEEKDLAARFGSEYEEYRKHVPVLVPSLSALEADRVAMNNVVLLTMTLVRPIAEIFWRVRAVGMENIPREGPLVLASNHMTNADPYVLGLFCTRMVHFITADEVFRHPLGRWLFGAWGAICKKKWARDVSVIRTMKSYSDKGEAIGIFPQGQYNWDGGVNVVADEVYRVLKFIGAPVVPCTFAGAHEAWPAWSFLPAMSDWEVRFFEPVHPKDYPDAASFRHALESKMFSTAKHPPVARRAMASHKGITTVAWGCVRCGGGASLRETDEGLKCSKCGAEWKITRDLKIVDKATGRAMQEAEFRNTLLDMLAEGRMDDAPGGAINLSRRAKAYQIKSSDLLVKVGEGILKLDNQQMTFMGDQRTVEIPVSDVDFTFINAAGHLVVSGPKGAFQFDIEGDSNLRWEDYLFFARGVRVRGWKTSEEVRARSREYHCH